MNAGTAPVCPRCGQLDAVRKVSSVVQEGVSVGSYETYYPGQIAGKPIAVPVKKEVVSQTALAQKLSMPPTNRKSAMSVAEKFHPRPPLKIMGRNIEYDVVGISAFLLGYRLEL